MKLFKILLVSVLLSLSFISESQVKIYPDMPVYIGNPTGGWVPIVINNVNRRIDAKYLGYSKIDSIFNRHDTLYWRNGTGIHYFKLTVNSYDTTYLYSQFITSIRRVNDSVQFYKNGFWQFAFKDSVGSGGSGLTYPNSLNKYLNGYGNWVTLNSDSLTEGSTNLFYTIARANLKLNISDTGSMLNPYFREVGYGLLRTGRVPSLDTTVLNSFISGGDTTIFETVLDSTAQPGQRVLWGMGNKIKSSPYFLYDSVNRKLVLGHNNISVGGPNTKLFVAGNVNFTGSATALSFIKSGGTSAQFLKADGSVDASTYLTSYTETDPKRVTSLAFTGTTTKTLTLTLADASTVTNTFTDRGILLTELSALAPLLYNNSTGVFSADTSAGSPHLATQYFVNNAIASATIPNIQQVLNAGNIISSGHLAFNDGSNIILDADGTGNAKITGGFNGTATISMTTTGGANWADLKFPITTGRLYTFPDANGTIALTSDIPSLSGYVNALGSIGSSPNANGATISGSTLTLQPASVSFGGIVTTVSQTFLGNKTIQGESATTGYALNVLNSSSANLLKVSNNISTGIIGIGITPLTGYGINTLYGIYTGANSTDGEINIPEQTAPGTPGSGRVVVYAKSDGLVYSKDDAGTETLMSGGSGGGSGTVTNFIFTNGAGFTGSVSTSTTTPTLSLTLDNSAVTLAKIANIADATILGNNTGGSAAPVALTASQTRTLLSLVIGTNVQAYDVDLTTWAGLSPATWAQNLITTANPSAVRYIKINADNSVTLNTASTQLSDLGGLSTSTAASTYVPQTTTVAGFALSGNVTLATLTIGSHLTGTSYNGSTGVTIATDGTSTATASVLVLRDASANISANNFLPGWTSTATAAGTTTLTVGSTHYQELTGSTTQTVKLPVVSTLALGHPFVIVNKSSGNVTVQSSGSNTIQVMAANSMLFVNSNATTGTDATVWDANYMPILTNVENTAISTWAGSTNITTLGTIGTGTWQGGVIGSTYGGTGVNNAGRTLTISTNSGTISFTSAVTLTIAAAASVSGTNTGDQTSIVGITGTLAQFNTAVTDADLARTDAANTFTGASTGTSWTMTTIVLAGGLTASGSGANTFAGSTGTFITSTGANTLNGAVDINAATTPSLTLNSGKTNTGFILINGKTSGGLKLLPVDAAGQTVTISLAAQTTGASTLTIPDRAGSNGTFAFTDVATLSSLTSIGTISTGTWQGTLIGATYGGTGVNNSSRTITVNTNSITITSSNQANTLTLANNLTTSGNFALTFTTTGTTTVTLPTSGTLVNTAVASLSSLTTVGTITSGGLGTGAVIGGVTMTLGSDANYDIYYRNSSGVLTRLAASTDGKVLTTHSTNSAPTWETASGSPTSTDNDLTISGSAVNTNQAPVSLTDGATITWDRDLGFNGYVTLAGNRTLAFSNSESGDYGTLVVTQDGTGGRTLAVPDGTVVLNSGASAETVLTYYYNGTKYIWNSTAGSGGDALTSATLAQFAATTSAQLRGVLSDELGTGAALFDGATPTALTLTNATGLPVGGITGLAAGVGTFLGTPSSANLISAMTDETGTGSLVFGTSPTLTTPKIANGGYIADGNGNELIIYTTTTSAVNELTFANSATGVNPKWTSSGGDADIGIDWLVKGAGVYRFLASASGPADMRLFEDADNGSNYVSFIAPASIASNFVLTLPSTTGTVALTNATTLSSLVSVSDLTTGSIGTGFVVKGVTMTLGSDGTGDLYYRNSSGVLTRIAAGSQNTILKMGASSVPGWTTETYAAPGTSGNVMTSDGTNWGSSANNGGWTVLRVSGSDVTTTGQSLIDVTGLLTGTLTNGTLYEIEVVLYVTTSNVTTGTEYGINAAGTGGASEVFAVVSGTTTTNAVSSVTIAASNTATAAFLTTSSSSGVITMKGFVKTRGSGTATISIQHLKVTSGTSTVKIGSVLRYRLAS